MPSCLMRRVVAFICACVQTKHSRGSWTAQASWGVKQSDVTVLVQSVSFARVWLAVGIVNMEGCRLHSTSPHTYPKMKAPLQIQKKDQKRKKQHLKCTCEIQNYNMIVFPDSIRVVLFWSDTVLVDFFSVFEIINISTWFLGLLLSMFSHIWLFQLFTVTYNWLNVD